MDCVEAWRDKDKIAVPGVLNRVQERQNHVIAERFVEWLSVLVNVRCKVLIIAAVMLAGLVLGVVLIQQYAPEPRLRYCGHVEQKSVKEVLQGFIGISYRHHCSSLTAINDLRTLEIAQRLHESETGTNATTLEELEEDFPAKRNRFGITLISEGTNWSARVPQQDKLAGHYLLTSAGRLYFNTTRPATTNDLVLHDWSR